MPPTRRNPQGLDVDRTFSSPNIAMRVVEWVTAERVTGIEPAYPAWKAGALPLSYTRVSRRDRENHCRRRH